MVYPEEFIAPMREELTRHGVIETRTPEEVDQLLIPDSGTVLTRISNLIQTSRPSGGLQRLYS